MATTCLKTVPTREHVVPQAATNHAFHIRLLGVVMNEMKVLRVAALLALWVSAVLFVSFQLQAVKALDPAQGQGFPLASPITIMSPLNTTYYSRLLELNVTFRLGLVPSSANLTYSLDDQPMEPLPLAATFFPIQATTTYANGTTANVTSIFSYYIMTGLVVLPTLLDGSHHISVYARYHENSIYATDDATVYFTVNAANMYPVRSLDIVYPTEILSPTNSTYNSKDLTLNVTAQVLFEPSTINIIMMYSLDGKSNVSISMREVNEVRLVNVTYYNGTTATVQGEPPFVPDRISGAVILPELAEGTHNLTVYAKYEYFNGATDFVGSDNKTVFFTVEDEAAPGASNLPIENGTYDHGGLPIPFTTPTPTPALSPTLTSAPDNTATSAPIPTETSKTQIKNGAAQSLPLVVYVAAAFGVAAAISAVFALRRKIVSEK